MLSTDPIDLLLNTSTGDVVVGTDLSLSRGVAGVVQAVRVRIALIAGEWFLDLDAGIPYFERIGVVAAKAIFGQKYSQAKAIAAFRAAILSTPGVVSVRSLTITFSGLTRALTVLWSAQTAFGDTPTDSLVLGT